MKRAGFCVYRRLIIVKTLVFWIFAVVAMAFMAGIEGLDMPKWVWIIIAVVLVIYIAAKKDIDKWLESDRTGIVNHTTPRQDKKDPPQMDIATQKPVPIIATQALPKIKLNESETHLSISEVKKSLMINCPNCGTEILSDAKRCYKCGDVVWF